jgi:hypothetical protein
VTILGLTEKGLRRLPDLRAYEGHGIPGGVVKCVDIRRNTKGEGSVLGST